MNNDIIETMRSLANTIGHPVKLMEVCGTHTMAAFRTGLRSLLPENVKLLSGPGCPVCVTPNEYLDLAIAIANEPNVITTTFGDMLRVPGTNMSLEHARAYGSDVRVVYSPLDALNTAKEQPDKRIVFLGVGFETTTPTVAWTIKEAKQSGISNYSVLCAHKTIPEAMLALPAGGDVSIDGFICPGHVSVITGARAYESVCAEHHIPCVITGFEAADMARAINMILRQISNKQAMVEIEYTRSVTMEGNTTAQDLCAEVFEKSDAQWRGLGTIPDSGLKIRNNYAEHDAQNIFPEIQPPPSVNEQGCICGDILRGVRLPTDCGLFSQKCTPSSPIGACMVSSEGTCAAYFKYARHQKKP